MSPSHTKRAKSFNTTFWNMVSFLLLNCETAVQGRIKSAPQPLLPLSPNLKLTVQLHGSVSNVACTFNALSRYCTHILIVKSSLNRPPIRFAIGVASKACCRTDIFRQNQPDTVMTSFQLCPTVGTCPGMLRRDLSRLLSAVCTGILSKKRPFLINPPWKGHVTKF
jgi:hypothetical protein